MQFCSRIIVPFFLAASSDFPVPPLPNLFQLILLQSGLLEVREVIPSFAFSALDLVSGRMTSLESWDLAVQVAKSWILPDRRHLIGWKIDRKAFLA